MFLPFHMGPEQFPDRPPREGPDHMPPEEEIFSAKLFHKIAMIEKLQRKAYGHIFDEVELHPSQGVCLKTISLRQGLSQRELADELRIERATATVMLQKLEKAGFIERRPDPRDQRVSRIYITEKGQQASSHTDDACNAFMASCLEGLDPDTAAVLISGLDLIEKNIFNFLQSHHDQK